MTSCVLRGGLVTGLSYLSHIYFVLEQLAY